MKTKNIVYIILMIVFLTLTYIFIDRGINAKTKNVVSYQENSDMVYKVFLLENDLYTDNYLYMNGRYVSSLVDDIVFNFKYDKVFDRDISGYYTYNVTGDLIAYKDNVNDIVWDNKYTFLDNQVKVLDQNDVRNIKLDEMITIDYDRYKGIFDEFIRTYGIELSGYLQVDFRVTHNINFKNIRDDVVDEYVYKVIIPLSNDTFRVTIDNVAKNKSSYHEFSNRERINYLFLVIGAFCFSIMVAFVYLVIKDVVKVYKNQDGYTRELKRIFNEYGDILVGVKRFYNKKKYNLIYVDSFKELVDVYNRVGNPITYREIKQNVETIFLITDDDNAWIYRMISKKEK